MMKQQGQGQSTNGDEHEGKQLSRVEQRCSTASRVECFLVGVGDLADDELTRQLL